MTTKTNDELHRDWADAVAAANQASDDLQDALEHPEAFEGSLSDIEANLEHAQNEADAAYQLYTKATSNWVTDAPRRADSVLVAGVAQIGEILVPSITFAFRDQSEPPITVTLIMSELDLRRFQKDLGKHIDQAIARVRVMGRK